MTVNARVAGVGSTFPAASFALTAKVWVPSASGAGGVKEPPSHWANGSASTRHSNREPGSGLENVNVGCEFEITSSSAGPESITVSGGAVST